MYNECLLEVYSKGEPRIEKYKGVDGKADFSIGKFEASYPIKGETNKWTTIFVSVFGEKNIEMMAASVTNGARILLKGRRECYSTELKNSQGQVVLVDGKAVYSTSETMECRGMDSCRVLVPGNPNGSVVADAIDANQYALQKAARLQQNQNNSVTQPVMQNVVTQPEQTSQNGMQVAQSAAQQQLIKMQQLAQEQQAQKQLAQQQLAQQQLAQQQLAQQQLAQQQVQQQTPSLSSPLLGGNNLLAGLGSSGTNPLLSGFVTNSDNPFVNN